MLVLSVHGLCLKRLVSLTEIGNIWEGTDPQGLGVGSDSEHGSGGMEGHRPDSLGVLQTTDRDKLRAGHLLVLKINLADGSGRLFGALRYYWSNWFGSDSPNNSGLIVY